MKIDIEGTHYERVIDDNLPILSCGEWNKLREIINEFTKEEVEKGINNSENKIKSMKGQVSYYHKRNQRLIITIQKMHKSIRKLKKQIDKEKEYRSEAIKRAEKDFFVKICKLMHIPKEFVDYETLEKTVKECNENERKNNSN